MLLNIGPMGNGKFDPKDVAILDGVGAWMKVNGESIRGTERTPLPVQAWGESTRKGNTLYLHVLYWPRKGQIVVGGLKSTVKRAYLLSDPEAHTAGGQARWATLDVVVQGPAKAPDPTDTVIALELEGEPATDPARLLSQRRRRGHPAGLRRQAAGPAAATARARPATPTCRTGRKPSDSVRWPVRLREPATFEVAIAYDADQEPGRAAPSW